MHTIFPKWGAETYLWFPGSVGYQIEEKAPVIHLGAEAARSGCPAGTAWLQTPLSISTMGVNRLAGCLLAACSTKCYYTGETAALCAEAVLQHSLEIGMENREAVYNDFRSQAFINARGSNWAFWNCFSCCYLCCLRAGRTHQRNETAE